MYVSKIPKTIVSLVQPAITSLAARLFVLTSSRPGAARFQPTASTFFETGLVTALYEFLLMSPVLNHLEIRHEMPYPQGGQGAPKQVDLWLRPHNGGYAHLVEAGDFGVGKVHRDLGKIKRINPNGSNWFLSFHRAGAAAADPWQVVQSSFARRNGLDGGRVDADQRLSGSFEVYRPDGQHETFGYCLLRAK